MAKLNIDPVQMNLKSSVMALPYKDLGPAFAALEVDPIKKEIFDAIGDLSKLDRLFSARVLVATYIPPRKSKGGIIFTDNEMQESVYQPAVGLVIAKGPRVFKDDASSEFYGQDIAIGDWVVHQGGARRVQINGVNCRIVDDTQIDMVVTSPDWLTHRQVDARVK